MQLLLFIYLFIFILILLLNYWLKHFKNERCIFLFIWKPMNANQKIMLLLWIILDISAKS